MHSPLAAHVYGFTAAGAEPGTFSGGGPTQTSTTWTEVASTDRTDYAN